MGRQRKSRKKVHRGLVRAPTKQGGPVALVTQTANTTGDNVVPAQGQQPKHRARLQRQRAALGNGPDLVGSVLTTGSNNGTKAQCGSTACAQAASSAKRGVAKTARWDIRPQLTKHGSLEKKAMLTAKQRSAQHLKRTSYGRSGRPPGVMRGNFASPRSKMIVPMPRLLPQFFRCCAVRCS